MKIYRLTTEERERISGLHSITESSQRDSAWKTLTGNISYNGKYIRDLFREYKIDKVTNVEDVINRSKKFMYDRLRSGYFNKILVDGSGGSEFAVEVSNYLMSEITSIIRGMNGILFLPIKEKDVDREMSKIDFDYIFSELNTFFNYGGYFTSDNIDPYVDKGYRFQKEFDAKFDGLTPQIKNRIVSVIKSRL